MPTIDCWLHNFNAEPLQERRYQEGDLTEAFFGLFLYIGGPFLGFPSNKSPTILTPMV